MDLLNELTINNLKLNKRRSIATIIGIMLSVALIFTVVNMVSSFRETVKLDYKKNLGDYHIATYDMTKEEYIKNNKDVEGIFHIANVGSAELDFEDDFFKFFSIRAVDDAGITKNHLKLSSGRLPQNDKELVIQDDINIFRENKYELGDILKLQLGQVELEEVHEGFFEPSGFKASDTQVEYTIVGFLDSYSSIISKFDFGSFTAITKYNPDINYSQEAILYSLDSVDKIDGHIKDLYNNDESKYIKNTELLKFYGVGLSNSTMNLMYGMAALISAIIMATSILVIRNSFAISIVEKTKQYGVLKSLGATDRQVKNDILFEGFSLGIIGIILGFALGLFVNYVLGKVLNYIIGQISDSTVFVSSVSPFGALVAILLSVVTIYISSYLIARKVKRISPIEAIRGSKDIKISNKDVKTPKFIEDIFGFQGLISYKNMKRNRKKFRTTTLSIILSVAAFIGMYSIMQHTLSGVDKQYGGINATLINTDYNSEMEETEGIDKTQNIKFEAKKDMAKNLLTDEPYSVSKSAILIVDKEFLVSNEESSSYFVMLNKQSFDDLLAKNNLDSSKTQLVLNEYISYNTNNEKITTKMFSKFDIKARQNIYSYKATEDPNVTDEVLVSSEEIDLKLTPITIAPVGFPDIPDGTTYIFVREGSIDESKLNFTESSIAVDTKEDMALSKKMQDYANSNPDLNNFRLTNNAEFARQNRNIILIVQIFVYGFILVITAIGITNIFNTITSNMQSRKTEFASLASVGMTQKDFKKMNILESFFLGFKSLIFGIPLGIIISIIAHKILSEKEELDYMFPSLAILISIIFVFAVVGIIMRYSSSKIKNFNIIETIRNENI